MTGRRANAHRLVATVLFISVVANAALVPLMPYLLATRAGWPLWQVGMCSASVTAVTIVVNTITSRLVDRGVSLLLICAIGGTSQALAGLFAGLALLGPAGLVPLVITLGAGGSVVPVFYAMGRQVGETSGADPARVNAELRVSTSAGWIVGPGLSFWVLGRSSDIAALGLVAALGVTGVVALLLVRSTVRSPRGPDAHPPPAEAVDEFSGANVKLRVAVVVVALFSFTHIVTTTSLALLMVEAKGVAEPAAGWVLGFKSAVEMGAILLSRRFLARFSATRILQVCAGIAVVAYLLYFLLSGWAVLVPAGVEGFYYGLFAAVGLTWVQSIDERRVGRTTGAYMTGIYTGALLGSPISGVVASQTVPAIALVSAGSAMAALVLLSIARRPRPPFEDSDPEPAEDRGSRRG